MTVFFFCSCQRKDVILHERTSENVYLHEFWLCSLSESIIYLSTKIDYPRFPCVIIYSHVSNIPLLLLFSCWVESDSFETPWTVFHQASLFMGFPRQESWSGLPIPFSRRSSRPRDQTHISCIAGRFLTTEPPGKPSIPLVMSDFPVVCRFCLHFEVALPRYLTNIYVAPLVTDSPPDQGAGPRVCLFW